MNPLLKARALVIVFWVLGMPLIVLSFVAIPQALAAGALAARLSWTVIPVLGLAICAACIVALLRNDTRAGGASFDRRWLGRYYLEILVAFVLYLVLFAAAVEFAPAARDPDIRTLIGVTPVLGLALMVIAVVRLVRRADDYHRARLLESFAVTAAVTAFLDVRLFASGERRFSSAAPVLDSDEHDSHLGRLEPRTGSPRAMT